MTAEGIVIAAGDLAPDREHVDECFVETAAILRCAELAFGQLETVFAATGHRLPQARHAVLARPQGAAALARAGFNVISCAGNHCLDWGAGALLETLDLLRASGVSVVGAGVDIRAARMPVVRSLRDGTRIAFLAYSSILPAAYWATDSRAGCAPMRAHTCYEPAEPDQPGTPTRIATFANQEDLEAMQADIRGAAAISDVVLVSMHWGIHFVPAVIANYQREVARAAIGAGAHAILGHHAHILKGVEWIEGRPVFYSLGNFATDLRMDPEHAARASFQEIRRLSPDWPLDYDSLYNFPTEARRSVLARFAIAAGAIRETSLVPLHIGSDAIPRPCAPGSTEFDAVVRGMIVNNDQAGLNARYLPTEDRILVQCG